MKKLLVYGCFLLGVAGCASPVKYNYTQQNYISKNISFPDIGVLQTTKPGDNMLMQGKIVEKDVLVIPEDIHITKYLVLRLGKYEKIGTNGNEQVFLGNNTFFNDGGAVLRRNTIDSTYRVLLKNDNEICALPLFGAAHCKKNSNVSIEKVEVLQKDAFQQTLIYNGKLGNKINIGYRESSGNLARPAFSNNIEYDLNESNTIGYKGALIEIISATNQGITYKVLKNFNNAQVLQHDVK